MAPSAALCILTFHCESHWHRQHQSPGMSRDSEPEVEGGGRLRGAPVAPRLCRLSACMCAGRTAPFEAPAPRGVGILANV